MISLLRPNLLISQLRADEGRPGSDRRKRLWSAGDGITVASNFYSIKRYYDASDTMLASFQAAFEKKHLDAAYIHGMRYCRLYVRGITKHNDYKNKKWERRRNQANQRSDDVLTKLEQVSEWMDAEELEKESKRIEAELEKESKRIEAELFPRYQQALKRLRELVTVEEPIHQVLENFHVSSKTQPEQLSTSKGGDRKLRFEVLATPATANTFQQKQAEFRSNGIPWKVDIGYHYTSEANIASIQMHGLLTKADRDAKDIDSIYNGSDYGDGVYTANSPTSSSSYGEIGLVVARLLGNDEVHYSSCRGSRTWRVLKSSAQCLPLVWYHGESMNDGIASEIEKFAELLQTEVVNKLFNKT